MNFRVLSTSLTVLVNIVVSHNLTRKSSVGMYHTYVLIIPTTLVCFFSTVIPTSLFILVKKYYNFIIIITLIILFKYED